MHLKGTPKERPVRVLQDFPRSVPLQLGYPRSRCASLPRNEFRPGGFVRDTETSREDALASALASSRLWYESPIRGSKPRKYSRTGKTRRSDLLALIPRNQC
jgi:hypothetical protein